MVATEYVAALLSGVRALPLSSEGSEHVVMSVYASWVSANGILYVGAGCSGSAREHRVEPY